MEEVGRGGGDGLGDEEVECGEEQGVEEVQVEEGGGGGGEGEVPVDLGDVGLQAGGGNIRPWRGGRLREREEN